MRLIMGLCLLALLAAGAAPFFMKGPDGRPLMTVDELIPDVGETLDDLERSAGELAGRLDDDAASGSPPAGGAVVHRWQDEQGVWHFSSEAPVGQASETVVLDGDINLVPATEIPPPEAATAGFSAAPGTLTPNPVELMRQAEAIKKQSEQRNAQLEALVPN